MKILEDVWFGCFLFLFLLKIKNDNENRFGWIFENIFSKNIFINKQKTENNKFKWDKMKMEWQKI